MRTILLMQYVTRDFGCDTTENAICLGFCRLRNLRKSASGRTLTDFVSVTPIMRLSGKGLPISVGFSLAEL